MADNADDQHPEQQGWDRPEIAAAENGRIGAVEYGNGGGARNPHGRALGDAHHGKGREEGRDHQSRREEPVDQSDGDPGHDARRNARWQPSPGDGHRRRDRSQPRHRANRQVDFPGREDQRHCHSHHSDHSRLPGNVEDVVGRQEPLVVQGDGKEQKHDDEADIDDVLPPSALEIAYQNAVDGLRQMLWGLFKKVVIANNCAVITNDVFANYQNLPASSLVIGMFLYTIQIYADFSGYSDMAIGVARLLGFNITKNFDFPFFAQNIADFWRRWHISLTSWLTEYVFTPLSIFFRDYANNGLILAIIINFTLIGIWHGANWTYILFGFLHGLYYIPLILKGTMNKKKKLANTGLKEVFNMLKTFTLVMLTFVIFKATSITEAFDFYKHLGAKSLFQIPVLNGVSMVYFGSILGYILLMFIMEWKAKTKEHALEHFGTNQPRIVRWLGYCLLIMVIYYFSSAVSNQDFIYLQF